MRDTGFARKLTTAGCAVALSLLLAACGSTGPAGNTPAASAPATPGSTPTPEATTPPVATSPFAGELATTPDQLSKYSTMSLNDFKALPPSERTAYFLSLATDPQKGLVPYAELYTYVSGNNLDALPATISVANTPQEIMKIAAYGERFAMSFDQATAEKALAGTMYDMASNSYGVMDRTLQEYAPISARVLGADSAQGHGILTGTFVSASEKMQTSDKTTYINIVISQSDGTKVSAPYYFVTNGTSGMWEAGPSTVVK